MLAPISASLLLHRTSASTDIFAPVSTPAQSIFELSLFVMGITACIFVVVGSLLVYSIVRFRKRKADDGREPAQVYGSLQVELAWTIIPVLITLVLFLATAGHRARSTSPSSATSSGGSIATLASMW